LAPIGTAGLEELSRYSTAEVKVITEFLRRGKRLQLTQAERIRDRASQPRAGQATAGQRDPEAPGADVRCR